MNYSTDPFSPPPPKFEDWFKTERTITIKEGMEQNPELREALEKVTKDLRRKDVP